MPITRANFLPASASMPRSFYSGAAAGLPPLGAVVLLLQGNMMVSGMSAGLDPSEDTVAQKGSRTMSTKRRRLIAILGWTVVLALVPGALEASQGKKKKKKKSGSLSEAIALYDQGKYDQAISLLNQIAPDQADNPEVFFYLGMSHKGLDQFDPAISNLERAAQLDRENFRARKEAGGYQFERRDYAAARVNLDSAAQLKPDDPLVQFQRGASAYLLGDHSGARAPLERAVELDPNHAHSHFFLGMTYYQLKDFGRAIEQLSIFVQQAPNAPEAAQARQLLQALRS
jgi:Flp pilus assembly protein TadD